MKECLKGDPYLPGRGTMEALQAVHSHEDSPSASGFHHGTQLHEGFHHFLLGRVVVGRIRLQEGKGGAEGDGLGNELPRTDACLGRALRNLPEGSPGSFPRREEGHGRGVQLRGTNQLQPKLEGRQPRAESLSASREGSRRQGEASPFPLHAQREGRLLVKLRHMPSNGFKNTEQKPKVKIRQKSRRGNKTVGGLAGKGESGAAREPEVPYILVLCRIRCRIRFRRPVQV
jgi:hypothetical protein